jgi:hypothetical protein
MTEADRSKRARKPRIPLDELKPAFSDRREIPADFHGPPWELDQILGPCNDLVPGR